MTERQKHIIRSMRKQGFSYGQIADTLGLTYNTVKSLCYREKLTAQITPDDGHCRHCGQPLEQTLGSKRKIFCRDKCRCAWWNKTRRYKRSKTGGHGEGLP